MTSNAISVLRSIKRRGLEIVLLVSAGHLCWLARDVASSENDGGIRCLRNSDFPTTYIGRIHLDLTSPNHYVHLTWLGPDAAIQEKGPFRSSPGVGWGANDCNDAVESNCPDSRCTPKGLRTVEGLRDHMRDEPQLRYVTVIDRRRAISFHAHPSVLPYPASKGCVRLEPYAARLIHDNSIVGQTEILIDGTWTNPSEAVSREKGAGSKNSE